MPIITIPKHGKDFEISEERLTAIFFRGEYQELNPQIKAAIRRFFFFSWTVKRDQQEIQQNAWPAPNNQWGIITQQGLYFDSPIYIWYFWELKDATQTLNKNGSLYHRYAINAKDRINIPYLVRDHYKNQIWLRWDYENDTLGALPPGWEPR